MKISAGELAQKIGAEVIGDRSVQIDRLVEIEDCVVSGAVAIAIDKKSIQKIKGLKPNVIILKEDIPELDSVKLIVNKGKEVLVEVLNIFFPEKSAAFISEKAFISKNVKLGRNVQIYPGVFLGENVSVGDNTIIYPNVVIYEGCLIGSDCIIHGNAVIGADGFGFIQQGGRHIKVPQKGNVIIGNDVEIGACTTIDRATIRSTIVGDGTKIDNKVQIAHNVRIGKCCILAGSSNVAGSSVLEANVILAGGAGVVDNITIGANSIIYAYTVITDDCPPNSKIYGTPVGDDYMTAMKRRAVYNKLPELADDVKKLKAK